MKVKKISKADQSVSYRVYQSDGLPHDVINGFLRNRDHRGYAPLTIKSHAGDQKEFFTWLDINEFCWSDVLLSDLENYLSSFEYVSVENHNCLGRYAQLFQLLKSYQDIAGHDLVFQAT